MELHEQLDQVKDANSFLAFAHALAEDKSNGDWENETIAVIYRTDQVPRMPKPASIARSSQD